MWVEQSLGLLSSERDRDGLAAMYNVRHWCEIRIAPRNTGKESDPKLSA
jgi:hypothetical protein